MCRDEIIQHVKSFCEQEDGIEYVSNIRILELYIIIVVKGENCIDKLNECLTNLGVEFTTTTPFADHFGSYVTLN